MAPAVLAAAARGDVGDEGREALGGQFVDGGRGFAVVQARLDVFGGDLQVGIDALFGGIQVEPGVHLVGVQGLRFMGLLAQPDHRGGEGQDQHTAEQYVEGLVAGAGRADGFDAHGAAMSAWSISTTWPGPASNST